MEWSKTKNIFIIAFLLLNILLGYQLYLKQSDIIQSMQWSSNNIEELKNILKQKNIKFDVDIPKEVPQMHFLQVKNEILANYYKRTGYKVESSVNEYYIDLIAKDIAYNYDEYRYFQLESATDNYFVYYQTKDKYPFFGAKIEFYINNDGTITYKQNYFEILNQGLDRQVISSYSALRTVLDQQLLPENSEIIKIELGYHGQTSQTSTQLLTPVWRITYYYNKAKEELFVNAMTGGVLNVVSY